MYRPGSRVTRAALLHARAGLGEPGRAGGPSRPLQPDTARQPGPRRQRGIARWRFRPPAGSARRNGGVQWPAATARRDTVSPPPPPARARAGPPPRMPRAHFLASVRRWMRAASLAASGPRTTRAAAACSAISRAACSGARPYLSTSHRPMPSDVRPLPPEQCTTMRSRAASAARRAPRMTSADPAALTEVWRASSQQAGSCQNESSISLRPVKNGGSMFGYQAGKNSCSIVYIFLLQLRVINSMSTLLTPFKRMDDAHTARSVSSSNVCILNRASFFRFLRSDDK